MEIIVQTSYGVYKPNKKHVEILKNKGYKHWADMGARTDKDIIEFIKKNGVELWIEALKDAGKGNDTSTIEALRDNFNKSYSMPGKHYYDRVSIVEVNISRPWTIKDYDGAESISYLDYNVVMPEINYCELKR